MNDPEDPEPQEPGASPQPKRRGTATAAIVAVVAALLLATVVGYQGAASTLNKGELRQTETTSSAIATSISANVQSLKAYVESFAGRKELTDALDRVNAGRAQPGDVETLGAQLEKLIVGGLKGITVTFLTNAKGALVAGRPHSPGNVGKDFSFRDWYTGANTSGKTYVSDAFQSAAPGNPQVVALATPVRNSAGTVIGFVGANYGLEALQSSYASFAEQQKVGVSVTDRKGTVLTGPEAPSYRGVKEAIEGRSGSESRKRGKDQLLTAWTPVPEVGWAVITDTPESETSDQTSDNRRAHVTAFAVGLVPLVLLGIFLIVRRRRVSP